MRPFVQFFFVICFILCSGLFLSSILGVNALPAEGKGGISQDLHGVKTLSISDYVSVPVSTLNKLQLMAGQDDLQQDLQLNRADYFLSLDNEQPSLFCRMHIYSPDSRLRTVRPFFSPSPLFEEVSVVPSGATVVTRRFGPEVSLLSPTQVEVTVRWRPLIEKGRIRFSSRHFSLTTLIVPSGKILPVKGLSLKWDDGKDACYEVIPPSDEKQYTSVEILLNKDGDKSVFDPAFTGFSTLFQADASGVAVMALASGAGREKTGGVVQILLPALWEDVTAEGHGKIVKVLPFDGDFQLYTIAISDTAPVFWELTLKGSIPLDKDRACKLSPGIPFGFVDGKKKSLPSFVGLMKDGPRRFRFPSQYILENLGLWRISDSRIIRIVTQWTGLNEECRELYEVRVPEASPELFVAPLCSVGSGSNLLVVNSLSVDTNILGPMGRSNGLSVYSKANYKIGSGGSGSISFSLNPSARLISVSVDGEIAVPGKSEIDLADDGSIVFTSKGKMNSLVSVYYSEIASEPGLFSYMNLALPKVSEPVFNSQWKITLPQSYNIVSVESDMSSSFSREVFFPRRLGNSVINFAIELVSIIRNEGLSGLLPSRLTSAFRKVWESDSESLSKTFTETVDGGSLVVTSPLSDISFSKEELADIGGHVVSSEDENTKGSTLSEMGTTRTGSATIEPLKTEGNSISANVLYLDGAYSSRGGDRSFVTLRAAFSNYISLFWSFATLAGLLSLTYLWSLFNDCAPVPMEWGIPLWIGLLLVLDLWFPFALPGYSWAFFIVMFFLAIYVLGIIIDVSLAVYRARKEALREAGTIGDLEGEEIFYSSRRKHNIVPLADLFVFKTVYVLPVPEPPDDEGIEFIVIGDPSDTGDSSSESDSSSEALSDKRGGDDK